MLLWSEKKRHAPIWGGGGAGVQVARECGKEYVCVFMCREYFWKSPYGAVLEAAPGKGTEIYFHFLCFRPNEFFKPGVTFSVTLRHEGSVLLRWGASCVCGN